MVFYGISKEFELTNEEQYETIGLFWDEMSAIYGIENLQGLGYNWQNNKISYAIGLKKGIINNYNASVILPDKNWITVEDKTENLKQIYDVIYKDGPLKYEIETFYCNGKCVIKYYR